MTPLEQYKAIFPLTGYISKEILETADRLDPNKCVGALTLLAALGENSKLIDISNYGIWANQIGPQRLVDGEKIILTTIGNINMMHVAEPRSVTFIVSDGLI